ncbi:FG-GAP repeat domain-containing protein [Nonomuraea harbinensis]|uniref:FG-GAP repeat domain-containing protein n=1 Tax=Nonomuraea harbinensis TaxID=1286938 RepID=A0ABW1C4Q1_9ACTN|nr:VCBS repeat-containing protein [Nonomuraea harbinensis]
MPRRMTIWLALGLLLAGCGGEPRPASRTPVPSAAVPSTPAASTSAASTPTALPSVEPRAGKRGRHADDADDDGRADLVVEARTRDGLPFRTVVHGSPRGLDPGRQTGATSKTSCFMRLDQANWAADFDGDGFGDILGTAREGEDGSRPCVLWGPHGLAPGKKPVRLRAETDVVADAAVAGDFDGDGAADLAMPSTPEGSLFHSDLVVLYGPFRRDGTPARQTVQASPSGDEFRRLTVDRIEGQRATGLIVHEPDDGEQTASWLLRAGPGGLDKAGHKLNDGSSAAFGDFDGDGTRDVAVGDNGSRNNEPGYETEPPSVHHTVTVYYGNGRTWTFTGTAGTMAAGDFDGDARDDLAFGGGHEYGPRQPVLVFRGAPDGLRPGGALDGVSPAWPRTAGDFDGDGDDELVLSHGQDSVKIIVTDGTKVLSRFGVPPGGGRSAGETRRPDRRVGGL